MIAEKYEIRKKPANRASKRNQKKILATTENLVYSTLDLLPKSFEDILRETKADAVILRNVLTELEIEGLIEEVGKGYYRLI